MGRYTWQRQEATTAFKVKEVSTISYNLMQQKLTICHLYYYFLLIPPR